MVFLLIIRIFTNIITYIAFMHSQIRHQIGDESETWFFVLDLISLITSLLNLKYV